MKTLKLFASSALSASLASLAMADAWYFDNATANNNNFSKTSAWLDESGTASPASFDSQNSYIYEANNTNNNTQSNMTASMQLGSFTVNASYSSTLHVAGAYEFSVGTFELNTIDGSSNQSSFAITGNNADFRVEGQLSALNEGFGDNLFYRNLSLGTRYYSGNADSNTALKSVYVGGDVNLKNYKLQINTVNGVNAEIVGAVRFGENSNFIVNANTDWNAETLAGTKDFTQTVKVGGLVSEQQGNGIIGNWAANAEGASRTGVVEIAGAGNYEFSGQIKDAVNMGGKLSIVKSGSGTQMLSGQNTYTGDTVVQNGKLLMSTASAESKLILQGGKFGATGDNALSINNVEWSGGGFSFNLAKGNFTLKIGTLSGDFSSTLLSEFEFSNITNGEFLLISLANESEALAAFNGKSSSYEQDGKLYEAIFSATNKELSVSFSQVPEPATCAAILGALALALAAYRRRA